jgi:hypothetical protein
MPRDCTDPLFPQFHIDVQSPWYRVSHTMPNKNRTRNVAPVRGNKTKQPKAKKTPFADAGAIVGSQLGSMFNAPYLKGVGKWLGSGIGQIFGSGDYQLVGGSPSYNVLMNGNQIPKFTSSKQTNIVCHREYLGDIQGTAGFNNVAYPLNPGVSQTFPWLSTIAQNYQEYKFHGVIFEFRPLITDFVTNGAPGVVIMATNYNADAVIYNTKQEMENSEYAVSVKPTRELMHGIECAGAQTVLPQLYIRTGSPPTGQDLRLYDLGNFQFATQTNPLQNLGELWVSYCVEFFKPILPTDVGGNVLSSMTTRSAVSNASPMGTIQLTLSGDLGISVGATTVTFIAQPGNVYMVTNYWVGDTAALVAYPAIVTIGLQALPVYSGFLTSTGPNAGVLTFNASYQTTYRCSLLAPGMVTITYSGAGTLPTVNTRHHMTVTLMSSEAYVAF